MRTRRLLAFLASVLVGTGRVLSAQSTSPAHRITVPYGITLSVPGHWTADLAEVRAALAGKDPANTLDLQLDESGHLLLVGTLVGTEEASVEISVKPSNVSQSAVRAMSPSDLASADGDFRHQITAATITSGVQLLEWRGTSRKQLGGCVGLLRLYTFAYPGKPPMLMESYGVYRGPKSVQIRIQYPEKASTSLLREVRAVRDSLRLECFDL